MRRTRALRPCRGVGKSVCSRCLTNRKKPPSGFICGLRKNLISWAAHSGGTHLARVRDPLRHKRSSPDCFDMEDATTSIDEPLSILMISAEGPTLLHAGALIDV